MAPILVVAVALFVDGFLYGLIIPLIPHLSTLPLEEWMSGLISASYAIGVILAIPFFSFFSDRKSRRRPILIGACFQLLSVCVFAFSSHFYHLVFARLMQGVAAAGTWTVVLALVAESFTVNRAQMMGYAMLASSIGLIVGPIAGGALYDWQGTTLALCLTACVSLLDFTLRNFLVSESTQGAISRTELTKLLTDPSILMSSLVIILTAWCWSILEALLPTHLESAVHFSSSKVGSVFTVTSIVYAFFCPLVGFMTDRYGSFLMMTTGIVTMVLVIPWMAIPTNAWTVGFLIFLIRIGYGFAMDPALSALAATAERHNNGAYALVYGVYNIAYSFGMVTSNLASGIVASIFSFQVALLETAVMLVCGLLLFKKLRKSELSEGASIYEAAKQATHQLRSE